MTRLKSSPSPTQPSGLDEDPRQTSLEDIYTGSTAVLIVGGSEQRDPENPQDLHCAAVPPGESIHGGPIQTGPAWEAQDLFTSAEFDAAVEFAKRVTGDDGSAPSKWGILSADHGVIQPWEKVSPADRTSVAEIGDDERRPNHHADPPWLKRRPDGREIVTEMDLWAQNVAVTLCRWVANFREPGVSGFPADYSLNSLLIVGAEQWISPLRERGVFDYGISRMCGNPNHGFGFPLTPQYLDERADYDVADTAGRLAWLSEAISQLGEVSSATAQAETSEWTDSDERCCSRCGLRASETEADNHLRSADTEVYCEDCFPDTCARCDSYTHNNGLGGYPLCCDCQDDVGGQTNDPYKEDETNQSSLTCSIHPSGDKESNQRK